MCHTVTVNHHGSVRLVDVACVVTQRLGGAEFGMVVRLLLRGEQSGLLELNGGTRGGEGEGDREPCWNPFACRVCLGGTQEEHLSDVTREIHKFGSLTHKVRRTLRVSLT